MAKPVPSRYRITTPYGKKNARLWRWLGYHSGDDYACPTGTSVYASRAGTVSRRAYSKSFGYFLVINHGAGITSWYCHMSSRSVAPGRKVKAGQFLGRSGSTGNVTGPHLHYEERKNGFPRRPVYNRQTSTVAALPKFPKGIRPNSRKPSAVRLQRALKRAGFMSKSVKENANYGPRTQAAVARFHNRYPKYKSRGVKRDVRIGPKGWAFLMRKAYR